MVDRVAFVENGRVPEIVDERSLQSSSGKVSRYLGVQQPKTTGK